MIRTEGVKFRGLLRLSGPTFLQGLRELLFKLAPVRVQQDVDSFGHHVCVGPQLVKGQLERVNLGWLSLGSCLIL